MIFKLRSNVEFEAKDIDDAFETLEKHFRALKKGIDSRIFIKGCIELTPAMRKKAPMADRDKTKRS